MNDRFAVGCKNRLWAVAWGLFFVQNECGYVIMGIYESVAE